MEPAAELHCVTRFEGSKTTDHFDVNASCADGYQGVASVKMCTEVRIRAVLQFLPGLTSL